MSQLISPSQMIRLALKIDQPILVSGAPGTGKTKTIEAIGREDGRPVVTVLASIREPSDFSGLPVITSEGGVRLAAPMWTEELGDNGILFLDEMNSAPPAVQASLLRVCFDKVVGEKKLSKNVRIVAAINPVEYAANGFELAPPLANRFMHIEFVHKAEDWANNFPDYWGFPPQIQNLDEKAWAEKRGIVAAYISTRPTLLLQFPKDESKRTGAWPSHRSWDYASRTLAVTTNPDEIVSGFCGTVGEGAAMDFHNWLKNLDLPDPEDVLKNYKKFEVPKRPDKMFAILSGIVSCVKNNPKEDRWVACWNIIGKVIDGGSPDVAAVWGRTLLLSFHGNKKFQFPYPDELAKFEAIFKAANVKVS